MAGVAQRRAWAPKARPDLSSRRRHDVDHTPSKYFTVAQQKLEDQGLSAHDYEVGGLGWLGLDPSLVQLAQRRDQDSGAGQLVSFGLDRPNQGRRRYDEADLMHTHARSLLTCSQSRTERLGSPRTVGREPNPQEDNTRDSNGPGQTFRVLAVLVCEDRVEATGAKVHGADGSWLESSRRLALHRRRNVEETKASNRESIRNDESRAKATARSRLHPMPMPARHKDVNDPGRVFAHALASTRPHALTPTPPHARRLSIMNDLHLYVPSHLLSAVRKFLHHGLNHRYPSPTRAFTAFKGIRSAESWTYNIGRNNHL
ncbi:hypothetical protein TARUN_2388 [Trichoderma arundinaceum]|uniref:Uncharacterized protein n=1 Tax=Trichoderma arundinaceum TaxID=490622 RepID=A0A395NUV2_TRIAR|nr:hypothetical protein TARUN_2388 [Trichoderma arundinaceum]